MQSRDEGDDDDDGRMAAAAASATVTMTTESDSSKNDSGGGGGWLEPAIMAPFNRFVVPVNGFITPALILLTLVTNCAVCAVLLRPHMRSPTNILLVAIATSDMLTGR